MLFTMTDLDRFTMALSLAVHIILAVIGIGLPVVIMIAEYLAVKRNDVYYRTLAKRLTISLLVLFAIGTASGTIVALDILFLWPSFFSLVANVAILPLLIEVFAFFGEAIFLAIYLYGRDRIKWKYAGVAILAFIAFFAASSGVLITFLNAFMNYPTGFDIQQYLANGTLTGLSPLAIFTAPGSWIEVSHVIATSYFVSMFLFSAYFAFRLLAANSEQKRTYYKKALAITLTIAAIFTFVSVITGIISIDSLYALQPEKYAAIEGNMQAQAYAPEIILNYVSSNNTVVSLFSIPNLQSILATGNASGMVPGLNQFPQNTLPPLFLHQLFIFMVTIGFGTGFFILLLLFYKFVMKRAIFDSRLLLKLIIIAGALALIVLECGWVMAEVGRQPWIIYNVMLVSSAANQSTSIIPVAMGIILFYIAILPITILVLRRLFKNRPLENELIQGGNDY